MRGQSRIEIEVKCRRAPWEEIRRCAVGIGATD
jgi:hypothetical protein